MSAYSLGLLLSIIVYLLVGSYAGRKVKHLEDYFVAGRNAPTLLIVGTLVASLMSTNAFMGETGVGYSGFPSVVIILTAVNCVGYVLGGLYFGRFLRRSRALTLAEYFGQRFSSRRGYTLFTLYSGSRGVVLTDTIMFLLFSAVALLGLAFIVEDAGGWFTAIRNLAGFEAKPEIISWHGAIGPDAIWKAPAESLIYGIILGVGWGIVVAVSPWQASRFLMARNEHTVIRSAVITAGVIMALYLVLMFSGAAINLINPQIDPAQENMIWAAMNIMPLLVGVLLMSGIMAAGLSSASTFLSLVAFSASNDIMPPRHLDDGARLKLSRQAMLVLSLAALAIAFLLPEGQLFWITYFAGTLFASSWGPVAFMSVWSNRITEAGAFWGIIAGLLGNVVTNIIALLRIVDLPVILDPILVGVFLSYLTIEIVSFRGKVSDREHAWRKRLHETPPEEIDFARTRRTLVWSGAMITFGIALSILMILFYWIPYRQVAADSALGELVLSLGVGFAVALTGVLAWRGTLRSYTVNK
jgi:sodium/pantothenate symporter